MMLTALNCKLFQCAHAPGPKRNKAGFSKVPITHRLKRSLGVGSAPTPTPLSGGCWGVAWRQGTRDMVGRTVFQRWN